MNRKRLYWRELLEFYNFFKKKDMNYFKIRENNKQFLALTSLNVSEFDEILPRFELHWDAFIKRYKLDGSPRYRSYTPKDKEGLNTIHEKLFFIMYYQKNNPLQEAVAASFDIDQGMANKWIHVLTPLLKKALKDYDAARDLNQLKQKLIPNQTYIADATDREIQRPKYNQEEHYSGKQKCHTIKNMIVVSLTGFIVFLSTTVSGKVHDKRLAVEQFGSDKPIELLADLGYQGYQSPNITVVLPIKKPKNQELTKIQKKRNQLHARRRVPVEHVNASIKRLRIVKEKNRNTKDGFRDLIMDLAVSLHNYRVTKRHIILLKSPIYVNNS
jgi:hypothetical protein